MSIQSLTLYGDAALTFRDAIALRETALAQAGIIGRVSCAEEQLSAVEAQKELVKFRRLIEEMRIAGKAPALKFCQQIDAEAKKLVKEADDEEQRVTKLIADFQALELAKVRAAAAAENERLTQLERERFAAAAQAKTHEQLEAVQAEFDQKAQQVPAPVTPARVEGQVIKEDWDFEIIEPATVAATLPDCVMIEPRRSVIKDKLNNLQRADWEWFKACGNSLLFRSLSGALSAEKRPELSGEEAEAFLKRCGWRYVCVNLSGIIAWKAVKAGVTLGRQR